jgi:hypothetical protein
MSALYVGDKVQTPDGVGYVEEFTSWRDRILEMIDAEAKEFTEQCRMECGPEYKTVWGRVTVRVGQQARRYPLAQVTVIEGRDGIG